VVHVRTRRSPAARDSMNSIAIRRYSTPTRRSPPPATTGARPPSRRSPDGAAPTRVPGIEAAVRLRPTPDALVVLTDGLRPGRSGGLACRSSSASSVTVLKR
jgi:hypothetical protein